MPSCEWLLLQLIASFTSQLDTAALTILYNLLYVLSSSGNFVWIDLRDNNSGFISSNCYRPRHSAKFQNLFQVAKIQLRGFALFRETPTWLSKGNFDDSGKKIEWPC